MLELKKFPFMGKSLRVIMHNDTPYFVAIDVCQLLGLNYYMAADRVNKCVPESDRAKLLDLVKLDADLVQGGICGKTSNRLNEQVNYKSWLVTESGLYRLIMRSNKPEAKKFQDWVFGEVLPSIRKTGKYSTPDSVIELPAHASELTEPQITLPLNKLGTKLTRIHALIGELITELNTL